MVGDRDCHYNILRHDYGSKLPTGPLLTMGTEHYSTDQWFPKWG